MFRPIGAGVIGYWYRPLNWFERIILIAAGLAMIYPESISDISGLIVLGIMFAVQVFTKNIDTPKKQASA